MYEKTKGQPYIKYTDEDMGRLCDMCNSGDDRSVLETLDDSVIKSICENPKYNKIEKELSSKFYNNKPIFKNKYPFF